MIIKGVLNHGKPQDPRALSIDFIKWRSLNTRLIWEYINESFKKINFSFKSFGIIIFFFIKSFLTLFDGE